MPNLVAQQGAAQSTILGGEMLGGRRYSGLMPTGSGKSLC
jgi:hypothetical protein